MRRIVISMAVVVLLTALVCAFSYGYVSRAEADMRALCETAASLCAAGDADGARAKVAAARDLWAEREPILRMLLPHEPLDEATDALAEDDPETLPARMRDAQNALEDMLEGERLTLANLF